jgi:hypothetical protein
MYINLQLALSSALAVSAWIYARSDFLCSLEVENANLELDGRVFTFFSRYSRENTLIFFASKCRKCKTAKSGAITLMWRKTAQKAEISQMNICLCFFEDADIYRYLKSVNHPLSRSFRDGVCPFGFRQAFAQPSQAGF